MKEKLTGGGGGGGAKKKLKVRAEQRQIRLSSDIFISAFSEGASADMPDLKMRPGLT